MSDLDPDDIIWVAEYKPKKIPEGYEKCPQCKGSGQVRIYYGPPQDPGFRTCPYCSGSKIVKRVEGE